MPKILIIAVIFFSVLGIAILVFKNKPETIYKAQIKETSTQEQKLTDNQLKEKIGQMIVIGFQGTEAPENSDIYKIIKDVKIGGVVLSDYDVPSNSFPRNIINSEQTKKLISDIQKYSTVPLFIAVDAEGGKINRLKEKYGFLPILSPEEMGKDKTLRTTEEESLKLAKELKNLGFNVNLAPVVDVNINPQNPIIGSLGRSFSSEPEEVVNNARVFIESHLKNNIITAAKHFPGHGSSIEDSHYGLVDITNTYKQEELIPYQQLNKEGLLNLVVTAHVMNKNIDNVYPATFSKIFLQDILRKQIGFSGVIMSDDLQMDAINDNYTFDKAIITAINAGCDIVYIFNNSSNGYDKDIAYKARDIIFDAVRKNKIEEKTIIESYDRILKLKKQFEQKQTEQEKEIEEKVAEIRKKEFELLSVSQNLTFGEVYDIAKYVENTTGVRSAFLLAISQEELTLEKLDMCYLTNFITGEGVRAIDGKKLAKTMKPDRDIQYFLDITQKLGRDPSKTLITCPMSFGWGGAMGPADFIPSTCVQYQNRVEKITGKPADPLDIRDAFLAMGLYLADSGASSKTRSGEWKAAMIYFSGSPNSPYTWYANNTLKIADNLLGDIEIIEKFNK